MATWGHLFRAAAAASWSCPEPSHRKMMTHKYCQRQAEEIEQLRGLVFVTAYGLRALRKVCGTSEGGCVISAPVAKEIDGILATLAEHEMGWPLNPGAGK
jgi:hypothetical protein